ncbi:hypothetical protein ACFSF7_05940 [Ligilactobacillus acidipiscis]|nr:hypothetical protein LAC02_52040 [Ligilactobacillus acidipiscis]
MTQLSPQILPNWQELQEQGTNAYKNVLIDAISARQFGSNALKAPKF